MRSMTAFVSQSVEHANGTLTCELRSVNQRFLDLTLRLPESLRGAEQQYREKVKSQLKRGKVELSLRWKLATESATSDVLSEPDLERLSQYCEQVQSVFSSATINVLEILKWPGVLQKEAVEADDLVEASLALLDQALETLVAEREREGATIKQFMLEACAGIQQHQQAIVARMPVFLQTQREHLLARVEQMQVDLEPNRLEQEMLLLMQKQDTAEEMQRLSTHVEETIEVIERGGVVGRRLDFLMQELNREVNTTASKSIDVVVTKHAVELKVLIEQIREQVQNVE